MTATGFAAMMKAAKITGVGEREVRKYLTAELEPGFCPSRRSVDILSDGHIEVKYDSINFTFEGKKEEEFIEWTEGWELTWLSKIFDDAKEDCKGNDLAKGPT